MSAEKTPLHWLLSRANQARAVGAVIASTAALVAGAALDNNPLAVSSPESKPKPDDDEDLSSLSPISPTRLASVSLPTSADINHLEVNEKQVLREVPEFVQKTVESSVTETNVNENLDQVESKKDEIAPIEDIQSEPLVTKSPVTLLPNLPETPKLELSPERPNTLEQDFISIFSNMTNPSFSPSSLDNLSPALSKEVTQMHSFIVNLQRQVQKQQTQLDRLREHLVTQESEEATLRHSLELEIENLKQQLVVQQQQEKEKSRASSPIRQQNPNLMLEQQQKALSDLQAVIESFEVTKAREIQFVTQRHVQENTALKQQLQSHEQHISQLETEIATLKEELKVSKKWENDVLLRDHVIDDLNQEINRVKQECQSWHQVKLLVEKYLKEREASILQELAQLLKVEMITPNEATHSSSSVPGESMADQWIAFLLQETNKV